MKVLRYLALVSFAAGLVLLIAGFIIQRGDGDKASADVVSASATATNTPTDTPTNAPSPTATPTPFNGAVARMKLPRFNVDSAIEEIGLLPGNQLDTPHNPHNTGWYNIYDKPGFHGNAVFSAHVDYFPNILGPFKNLAKSEIGDDVVVVMENGLEYKYRIIRKQRYDANTIPMGDLISAPDKPTDKEWITLITCGGEFRQTQANGAGEYLQRDVVVAERYQ